MNRGVPTQTSHVGFLPAASRLLNLDHLPCSLLTCSRQTTGGIRLASMNHHSAILVSQSCSITPHTVRSDFLHHCIMHLEAQLRANDPSYRRRLLTYLTRQSPIVLCAYLSLHRTHIVAMQVSVISFVFKTYSEKRPECAGSSADERCKRRCPRQQLSYLDWYECGFWFRPVVPLSRRCRTKCSLGSINATACWCMCRRYCRLPCTTVSLCFRVQGRHRQETQMFQGLTRFMFSHVEARFFGSPRSSDQVCERFRTYLSPRVSQRKAIRE